MDCHNLDCASLLLDGGVNVEREEDDLDGDGDGDDDEDGLAMLTAAFAKPSSKRQKRMRKRRP